MLLMFYIEDDNDTLTKSHRVVKAVFDSREAASQRFDEELYKLVFGFESGTRFDQLPEQEQPPTLESVKKQIIDNGYVVDSDLSDYSGSTVTVVWLEEVPYIEYDEEPKTAVELGHKMLELDIGADRLIPIEEVHQRYKALYSNDEDESTRL